LACRDLREEINEGSETEVDKLAQNARVSNTLFIMNFKSRINKRYEEGDGGWEGERK
jgi:hypothetical protein